MKNCVDHSLSSVCAECSAWWPQHSLNIVGLNVQGEIHKQLLTGSKLNHYIICYTRYNFILFLLLLLFYRSEIYFDLTYLIFVQSNNCYVFRVQGKTSTAFKNMPFTL